ncbi:hypothetical protein [Duganella radicis]|uniref:Uncharacterized protein n=1 Tax=Duganella radicis TaxID=551988 RepID=A0A6L6PBS1_9BURK|nr:hypothetical protein [Duganella radicis]MTV36283.1 hypothetical protein [Duganella radicis]
MSNNVLLAVAIGAAVFLVVQKQAKASSVNPGGTVKVLTPQQVAAGRQQSANVNADMWTRLLGKGFTDLAAGSAAIGKNVFGQLTSSDGKPINGGDPLSFYYQLQAGDAVDLPSMGGYELPGAGSTMPVLDWDSGGSRGYDWNDIAGLA